MAGQTGSMREKKARKSGASGSGGSSTSVKQTDLNDFDEGHGNAALAAVLAGQNKAGPGGVHRFNESTRGSLLAGNDRLLLAAMIYSESTPSEVVNDEMLALACVGRTRVEHLAQHPEDAEILGAASYQQQLEDPLQFLGKPTSQYTTFMDAARFNAGFATEEALKHAEAAIAAAMEIYNVGNPFEDDYMIFCASGEVPHAEMIDPSTRAQYGALIFWAIKPQQVVEQEEEEVEGPELDASGGEV